MVTSTAILVTAYCGGNDPVHYKTGSASDNDTKKHMALTLARYLKNTGYYICYSSHTALDTETQNYCNAFLYDSDNDWQINGYPRRPNHGVPEMTAMLQGMLFLKLKGFTKILKLTYDQDPSIDYIKVIERCNNLNAKMATYENYTDYGMMCFWGEIDFLIDSLPLDRLWCCEGAVETCWKQKIRDLNMSQYVYGYDCYETMFDVPKGNPYHYSYVTSGLHEYKFK